MSMKLVRSRGSESGLSELHPAKLEVNLPRLTNRVLVDNFEDPLDLPSIVYEPANHFSRTPKH